MKTLALSTNHVNICVYESVKVLSFTLYVAEEADTDLETDRLLGQQRTDDQGFYDDNVSRQLFSSKIESHFSTKR